MHRFCIAVGMLSVDVYQLGSDQCVHFGISFSQSLDQGTENLHLLTSILVLWQSFTYQGV